MWFVSELYVDWLPAKNELQATEAQTFVWLLAMISPNTLLNQWLMSSQESCQMRHDPPSRAWESMSLINLGP